MEEEVQHPEKKRYSRKKFVKAVTNKYFMSPLHSR